MKTKTTVKTVTVDGVHRLRLLPHYDAATGKYRIRVTYLGLAKGTFGVLDLRDERADPKSHVFDTVYVIDNALNFDEAAPKAVEMFRKDNGI